MKFTSRKLLAAALLAVIPMSSALACTTANWTAAENGGGTVAPGTTAGNPGDGVARYSGECGLAGTTGQFVTNNAPDGETTYRARFYVHTGSTGTTTVFRATADDSNAGAEVIRVDYDAGAGSFVFAQNGSAAGSVTGIVANKWYSVEVFYDQNTTFSAEVSGNQTFTGSLPATVAGAGTIGSHSLGAIAGGGGTVRVDAFESTRSADTPIGALCRADANGDGVRNSGDGLQIRNEFLNQAYVSGQPDCNEDGIVNSGDGLCVRAIFLSGNGACN